MFPSGKEDCACVPVCLFFVIEASMLISQGCSDRKQTAR